MKRWKGAGGKSRGSPTGFSGMGSTLWEAGGVPGRASRWITPMRTRGAPKREAKRRRGSIRASMITPDGWSPSGGRRGQPGVGDVEGPRQLAELGLNFPHVAGADAQELLLGRGQGLQPPIRELVVRDMSDHW